jgi:hypothetical protein
MTIRLLMSWRSSRVRLHGETEGAARDRYQHYLQESLACIHPSAYFYMSRRPLAPAGEWALTTNPSSIELDVAGGGKLYLSATQSFRMRKHKGEWRVSTQEYIYNVGERPDARDYMFAWHWHPNQRPECHLHVDAALSNEMKLTAKHLPTARVSFEEALWFLIDEFDVVPAKDRAACQDTLRATRERHERFRTWWGSRKPGSN